MKTLKSLKSELAKEQKKVFILRNKIENIEEAKKLPELKKKLEGKFFKYMNSASGEEKWPIYVFVKEVVKSGYFIGDSFETSPINDNMNEFRVDQNHNDFLCQIEITPMEYHDAMIDFESKVLQIVSNWINSRP